MNTSKSAPANRPGLAAILLVAGVLALPALAAEEQPPPAGTAPAPKGAPAERLDQLVAPIALYPDPLLMQILMASTYPLEIVQAERWIKERPKLRGEELDKILTAQGPHAPEGARSYVADGRMTGGFALVAYPVAHGSSGVMTFVVNQLGIVFQKDLGTRTAVIAEAMTRYDPDDSWDPVE